jgi:hypothetical protein
MKMKSEKEIDMKLKDLQDELGELRNWLSDETIWVFQNKRTIEALRNKIAIVEFKMQILHWVTS